MTNRALSSAGGGGAARLSSDRVEKDGGQEVPTLLSSEVDPATNRTVMGLDADEEEEELGGDDDASTSRVGMGTEAPKPSEEFSNLFWDLAWGERVETSTKIREHQQASARTSTRLCGNFMASLGSRAQGGTGVGEYRFRHLEP